MKKSTEWYIKFYQDHKNIVNMHIFITILIMPIEIIIFSIFTKYLFGCLSSKNYERFSTLFVYFLFSLILLQLLYAWKSRLDDKILPIIQIYIRKKYMQNVLEETNDNINTPQIMNYITIMPKYFYQNYDMLLKFWIPFFCTFFFFCCFIFWYKVSLGVFSLFYLSGLITLFIYGYRNLVNISKRYFENEESLMSSYENILINNESVNSFNAKEGELNKLHQEEVENNNTMQKLIVNINLFQFGFLFFILIFILGLFFYLNKLRVKNVLPNWKFFVFVTIMFFMIREVVNVNSLITRSVYQQGSLRNIEIFESTYPSKYEKEPDVENFKMKNGYNIEFKNLSYTFDEAIEPLLKDINLKIKENDNLLIKGSIGSGKSTLAKLLMKWYKPKDGSIEINNINVKDIPIQQLRKHQYLMTQNIVLFSNKTILENIFYNSKLKKDALHSFDLPKTFLKILDKKVIKNGVNISGGSKRLIHVLRCFFHPANIVIMDEPTDNLDETTTKFVISLIQKLQKKKTVICISHDPRLNAVFDNFYYLNTLENNTKK